MKFGIRKPSIKKRIAAKTSVKRIVRHNLGLKAPRGMGWFTNPKKAAYNRIYRRTTKPCLPIILIFVLITAGTITLFGSAFAFGENSILDNMAVFLPIIRRDAPPPTPTPTPTETPTPTATVSVPTWTPTMTPTSPPSTTGDIQIVRIFYNGSGSSEPNEYVEIKNDDPHSINVYNWSLADSANHVFRFPSFVMASGQTCRIYTNENHPEYCGFNYRSSSAIWNNSGDCAYLRDNLGNLVDDKCY